MRTVEIQLFKASELTEDARERARRWYRELEAQDFGSHGEIYEPAQTAAALVGIEFASNTVKLMGGGTRIEPDIRWSGFSSQGDGASFVGTYRYAKGSSRAVRKEFPMDKELHRIADGLATLQRSHGYKIEAQAEQTGRYVHSRTMYAYLLNPSDKLMEHESEVLDPLNELLRDFADWIYRGLEEEYEYRLSDEAIDEGLEANEYDFTADGRRFS